MNGTDRIYTEKYLLPFRKYDMESKTPYRHPNLDVTAYRNLIEEAFPEPILF